MIIKKVKQKRTYIRIDPKVARDNKLSNGAKCLYLYLLSFHRSKDIKFLDIQSYFGISVNTLQRRLTELKQVGLVLTKRSKGRVYNIYIGSTDCKASTLIE